MAFVNMLMGGGDDPKELTPQQRREWNTYVDYLEKKGYKGSAQLDKKDTGLATSLFNQFKKENPSVSLSLDHVKTVQSEMENLANAARNFEQRRGNPNAASIMAGTSKVDGWPGSKTTSFKFPDMEKTTYNNSVLTSHQNLGILDPKLRPTDSLSQRSLASTPALSPNVKLEKMADGKYYYEDPKTGDWKLYNK